MPSQKDKKEKTRYVFVLEDVVKIYLSIMILDSALTAMLAKKQLQKC